MKLWRALAALLLLAILGVGGFAAWWLNKPLDLAADSVGVSVELGTPPR